MAEIVKHTASDRLKELATFQGSTYDIKLLGSADRSQSFISLVTSPTCPGVEDVTWRNAIDYFIEQAHIQVPEPKKDFFSEIVQHIFAENEFDQPFLWQQGVIPAAGQDGYLEWLIEKKPSGEAEKDDTGRVDFYQVSNVINVSAGDALARIHPPKSGGTGMDVFGEPIASKEYKQLKLKVGKGARLDESDRTIYADVDGGLSYSAGVFSVEPVYQVAQDLDFSTGNIAFRGMVNILGSVQDGFAVQAQKDIMVGGVVGAGIVESGGDIIVKGGVAGKEKGRVRCGGKLQAKYLSAVHVTSEQDVEIFGEIVNSTVNTLGSVIIPKGKVFNSEITANGDVIADTLGSEMGVRTKIYAGVNHLLKQKLRWIDSEVDDLQIVFERIKVKIAPILADTSKLDSLPAVQQDIIRKLALELKLIKEEGNEAKGFRTLTSQMIAENTKRKIVVYKGIHPGVELQIGDCRKNIETYTSGPTQFVIDEVNRVIISRRIS